QLLKRALQEEFKCTDFGICQEMLGINIIRAGKLGPIMLNQSGFIDKIFADVGEGKEFTFSQRILTPLHKDFNPDPELSKELNEHEVKTYQSLVGALLWIAGMTRPDIAYCVGKLAQHNKKPCYSHLKAAMRVLHFTYRTRSHGICF